MAFTAYRFEPEYLKARAAEAARNLKVNRGLGDLAGFGLSVIIARLKKDPRRYVDYGPYWWAIKDLLREAGHTMGDQSDPMVLRVYTGETPEQTLVAAEAFRDDYLQRFFIYTNQFTLDPADGPYVLFDLDMEQRAPGLVSPG